MEQEPSTTVRLEILSRPDLLAPVRSMVISMAERFGFDQVECGHLALAVDEALANVIRHAYAGSADERIWITISLLESPTRLFRVEIEDEGEQCEIDAIAPRDLGDVRPGGLGVHLMREVTDRCVYEHRSPRGMRVILEKTPTTTPQPTITSSSPDDSGTESGSPHENRN